MKITLMYLYYNSEKSIELLEKMGYPEYPIDLLFIDDGSTVPLKLNWKNSRIIRIEEDIPWNLANACNVGFYELKDKIAVRLDIDHFFLKEDIVKLEGLTSSLKKDEILRFNRIYHCVDGTVKNIPSASNIFMTYVNTILDVGGYNERFCGNYGYEDKELMYRLGKRKISTKIVDSPSVHVNPKLGTIGLNRDLTVNKKLFNELTNNYSSL